MILNYIFIHSNLAPHVGRLVFFIRGFRLLFTIASAMVIYVSKLPLGACSIRACSISKLRKWIGC